MDRYEKAALLDFVATVMWPTRTVRLVSNPVGESAFDVIGSWATATDLPLAWVNGNRVAGAITWLTASRVQLPVTAAFGDQVIILVSPGSGSGYLPRNPAGVVAMLGNLLMGENTINNLGAAVSGHQAVRKDQVLSMIAQQLGGNYVSKAGDQMAGVLALATAPTDPSTDGIFGAHSLRRDMAALILANATAAERTFLAKPMAPSTVDGDGGAVLTTKDWVSLKVTGLLGSLAPNRHRVWTTPGPYTFVPDAGVTVVYVVVCGGGGGNGGGMATEATPPVVVSGGRGGVGRIVLAAVSVVPGSNISVVVGGPGGNGGGHDSLTGGGGGGGGRSSFAEVIAGGGGGGGGADLIGFGSAVDVGGVGGAGGTAGSRGHSAGGAGGTAGSGGNELGGVGGAAKANGGIGTITRGVHPISPFAPPPDLWPATPGQTSTGGAVLVLWRA